MSPQELRSLLADEERSQNWLARKVGVSRMTVSMWVRGERPINDRRSSQIREIFNAYGAQR